FGPLDGELMIHVGRDEPDFLSLRDGLGHFICRDRISTDDDHVVADADHRSRSRCELSVMKSAPGLVLDDEDLIDIRKYSAGMNVDALLDLRRDDARGFEAELFRDFVSHS